MTCATDAPYFGREAHDGSLLLDGTILINTPLQRGVNDNLPSGNRFNGFSPADRMCKIFATVIVVVCLLALPHISFAQTVASPDSYLAHIISELQHQWPTNRTITIVCHGHSVPAGYFKTPVVDSLNAYPHLLYAGLKERFPYAVINVIVTAKGGEDSESGAKRFEQDVLPLNPDVLTIDYSLNDRHLGLHRAQIAWRSMITNALAHQIKVLLLTPTPDLAAIKNPKDELPRHAEQVRRLAAEYSVGLVDSFAAFERAVKSGARLDDLMAQSNHPNRRGHELVAAELLHWFQVSQ
jgi:lysophospholipase L1-like esterase